MLIATRKVMSIVKVFAKWMGKVSLVMTSYGLLWPVMISHGLLWSVKTIMTSLTNFDLLFEISSERM